MGSVPDVQAGAVVYRIFSPRQYGRVLERLEETQMGVGNIGWHTVVSYRVRWRDGKETTVLAREVSDLAELIATTRRKLTTHETNYAKGQAL